METIRFAHRRPTTFNVPTRLEGMETVMHRRLRKTIFNEFRPDLRGWKRPQLFVLLLRYVEVPTRLEGMETARRRQRAQEGQQVPTRLEGMETAENVFHELAHGLVPTRLEGMETVLQVLLE